MSEPVVPHLKSQLVSLASLARTQYSVFGFRVTAVPGGSVKGLCPLSRSGGLSNFTTKSPLGSLPSRSETDTSSQLSGAASTCRTIFCNS